MIGFDTSCGKTVPLMLRSRKDLCPDLVLQYVKNEKKEFDSYTYSQVYKNVIELAVSLKKFGVKRGDKVGLISDNRREWLLTDMALLSLGAADVPRGCDSVGTEIRFILNFSDCNLCFLENSKQLEKILEKVEEIPQIKNVILFDFIEPSLETKANEAGIKVHHFLDFEKSGKLATDSERNDIENEMDKTSPDEVATIIFTSGTTGIPKGVMLTHDSFIAQCEVVGQTLPFLNPGDKWLSVLPIWHAFERTINYLIISLKNGIIYSQPIARVMLSDMELMQPNTMCGVPRLWESVAQGIFRAMKQKGGATYLLFKIALAIGTSYQWARDRLLGLVCRYKRSFRFLDFLIGLVPFIILSPLNFLFDKIIFKKIRMKLGGKMKYAISGGGSLQHKIDMFYHSIGFNLLEGYGITEAGPVLSVRNPYKPRFGCVGQIYASATVKIVPLNDGKISSKQALPPGKVGAIFAKGRQIMKGYYKRDDLTSSVIDSDGFLNTGDIGMMTFDNEIKIVGRAKDTIVILGGSNIEPLPIEQALNSSQFIETSVVVGQDQKRIGALIVPSKENVLFFAENNHLKYSSYEELLKSDLILQLFQKEISSCVCEKTGFKDIERIYKFVLLPESFVLGKEINGKYEIMRHKVVQIYKSQIQSLFK